MVNLWNSLPHEVEEVKSLNAFKKKVCFLMGCRDMRRWEKYIAVDDETITY